MLTNCATCNNEFHFLPNPLASPPTLCPDCARTPETPEVTLPEGWPLPTNLPDVGDCLCAKCNKPIVLTPDDVKQWQGLRSLGGKPVCRLCYWDMTGQRALDDADMRIILFVLSMERFKLREGENKELEAKLNEAEKALLTTFAAKKLFLQVIDKT